MLVFIITFAVVAIVLIAAIEIADRKRKAELSRIARSINPVYRESRKAQPHAHNALGIN